MDLLTPKFEVVFDDDDDGSNIDDKQFNSNDRNDNVVIKQSASDKIGYRRTVQRKRSTVVNRKSAVVKKYKKKRQQCPQCSQSYSKREYLSKHMQNAHSITLEKKRPGRQCPFFDRKNPNDPRPYKCDQCVKEYAKSKHLARHRRTHFEKRLCNLCNEECGNYGDHMLRKHGIELPRPFECDICKKTYRTKTHIQTHMRIHRVEARTFACSLCPKSYCYNTDLRKHMKTHSLDRSIICDICGDAFKSVDTLRCHLRRHTGERPYKCSLCPRAFSTSNSLDIHNRTHTGERPFQCEFCEKRFSDASTLHVHKRLHTNENPYVCHLCGRRTKQASNLRSHYKHFHKNNDITGRQIRLNSRIFNRYKQSELDAQLQESGDLMVLLERGLQEYHKEEREKNCQIEQALKESVVATAVPPQTQSITSTATTTTETVIKQDEPKAEIKIEENLSSFENPNAEVDVKMEVIAFDAFDDGYDAFDSVPPSVMQSDADIDTDITPMSPIKQSTYNLRRGDRTTTVKTVQPKIESVFLMDGAFQTTSDDVDFSIDDIKCESDSDDNENNDNDNDWQSDKNGNASDTATVEVKKYKKKRQQCPKCEMTYSKREYLKRHMINEHNATLEKKRPGKNSEFFVNDPNDPRPYKCNLCDKEYMRSKHLTRHRLTHFDQKRCGVCNKRYRNYERHMLKNHRLNYESIGNNGALPGEMKNETNANDTNSHSADESNGRTSKTENGVVKPIKATLADAVSENDKSALKIKLKRKKSKHKQKTERCIPCNRKFHDMAKHWVQHHLTGIDRPFECYVCHRNYKRFEHIKYHLKTHGNERNYQCHVCGDAFFLSNELRKHIMYRHQVERPFKCTHPQCKNHLGFKNLHALNVHGRTHSETKPYVCNVCAEAFAALSSLKIHERKHTGEKPYVCEFCKKAFADCSTHKQHVRIHTGDKPYRCHLCDRRTAQAGNLKSHYRHYHKVIVKSVSMYLDPATRTMADDFSVNQFNPNNVITYPLFDPTKRIEE